ncbi:MAG: DMP19 family protein [Phycisphaerales bacterium]
MSKNSELCELANRALDLFWDKPFEKLTEPEQVFRAIWELEADVNNGGFAQYYLNSSGDSAWFAPTALEQIGAKQASEVVAQANALFPSSKPPAERRKRAKQLDKIDEDLFEPFDDQFMSYPDDLTDLLHSYVSKHRSQIAGADQFISDQE